GIELVGPPPIMGLLSAIFGDGGAKARAQGAEALAKAKYEAAMTQAERDKEHSDAMILQQRDAANKMEHVFHEKAAAEKIAHEEKMRLEREKSDLLKEAADANLRVIQESHERQRILMKESEEKRIEIEKNARDTEFRQREENEQKREIERTEAREREERSQREMTKAINEANREVVEMKDKTHDKITQLVMDNQKSKEELMKENNKIIADKDAANAAKLDQLTTNYQSQVREAQESAKQREDALHLERKAVDEKYRKEMENMSKMSKEERDKMTDDYHKRMKEKDEELSRNHREKDAKMDELHKNHLEDQRKAHEEINKLQEIRKEEVERLHRENEKNLREHNAKQEEMLNKMLEQSESKNAQLLYQSAQMNQLIGMHMQEQAEFLRISSCREELAPLKELKSSLLDNATKSCELWYAHEEAIRSEDQNRDLDDIKNQIRNNSKAMKNALNDIWRTIDECGSLRDQKQQWKGALQMIDVNHATPYDKAVRRTINGRDTPMERFHKLEDQCEKLKTAIQDLPDMIIESLQSLMSRNAQATITFIPADIQGVTKAITAPKQDGKIESIDGENGKEAVIEEP
ncbi:hypothetical protein PENTCL1PPCAC_5401, partial [Pristionchus entomophagus]